MAPIPYYGNGKVYITKNGVYKINATKDGELEFHSDGYFSQRVKIENKTEINIVLEKDNRKLIFISGKVTNEKEEPLVDVIIRSKRHPKDIGTDVYYRTNKSGIYKLGTSDNGTLLFSLEGYETQEIPVNKRDEINVVMKKAKVRGEQP